MTRKSGLLCIALVAVGMGVLAGVVLPSLREGHLSVSAGPITTVLIGVAISVVLLFRGSDKP